MNKGKAISLQTKIIVLILAIIITIIMLLTGLFAKMEYEQTANNMGMLALQVANTVSLMPSLREAFKEDHPSETIQPLIEEIREDVGAEFIVIGNTDSIRYAHPDENKIGRRMMGEDNDRALLQGESYISEATGSLGPSLRGKSPIFNSSGEIIGVVSVGFLVDDLKEAAFNNMKRVLFVSTGAILFGVISGIFLARNIRKDILGLEPYEIASLYHERSAILYSVKEGIIAIDGKGIITMLNPAAKSILNIKEEVINTKIEKIVPGTTIYRVLETGQAEKNIDMMLGDRRVIVNRTPIMENDQVTGVVSSFRDKTEIDEMVNTLSEVKQYSEELRAQTHEFTNKLYVLSGLMQLGKYDEAVKLIQKESGSHEHMQKIVFEQIADSNLQAILLGKMAKASERKIHFKINADSSTEQLPSHITISFLITIIGNIIDNAFEATEGKTERIVSFFTTDIGRDIVFEVSDNGYGIEESDMERIFEKGFSTKAEQGRGYGLSLVAQTIRQLSGHLEIDQKANGGSVFTVFLPKEIKEDET
ncbi:ATP-binding protein [Cytobacillus gottheilii]|uniref:ATP-binding protein n=1 Tax=Cytobacillus gottheilii TaxID=859144 RepID=UPI0009BBC83C|nr:sensor histidine kinase [Cytobacillus gottheilii]